MLLLREMEVTAVPDYNGFSRVVGAEASLHQVKERVGIKMYFKLGCKERTVA